MGYREKDFAGEIALTLLIHNSKGSTTINSELGKSPRRSHLTRPPTTRRFKTPQLRCRSFPRTHSRTTSIW